MKKIFCVAVFILFKTSLFAQIYQYASNRAVVTEINTNETHIIHTMVSFTIDNVNKKITIVDSIQTIIYKIISAKTTKYDAAGTERHEYKCTDKKEKIQLINLVLFSENLQKQLHISGQFEITIGSQSYAYDLRKKISN